MTNKEALDNLKWIESFMKNDSIDSIDCTAKVILETMKKAIKCVELMPELVEALHKTNNLMFNLDDDWSYDEQYKANEGMINKAKELIK